MNGNNKIIEIYKNETIKNLNEIILLNLISITELIIFFPIPFLIQEIVNKIGEIRSFGEVMPFITTIGILSVAKIINDILKSYLSNHTYNTIAISSKNRMLSNLSVLPRYADMLKQKTAYLIDRIEADSDRMTRYCLTILIGIPSMVFTFIVSIYIAYRIDIRFLVLGLIIVPLFSLPSIIMAGKMKYWGGRMIESQSLYSKNLFSLYKSVKILMQMNQDRWFRRSVIGVRKDPIYVTVSDVTIKFKFELLQFFVNNILFLIICYIGLKMIISGNITFASFLSFFIVLAKFKEPYQVLSEIYVQTKVISEVIKRLERIVGVKTGRKKNVELNHNNKLKMVDCAYSYNSERYIFKNISFSFEQGIFYNVSGGNGCGKSTFSKVLSGYLLPNEGEVKINSTECRYLSNVDINKVCMHLEHETTIDCIRTGNHLSLTKNGKLVKNKLEELLDEIGIGSKLEEQVEKLSAGQRQMLGYITMLLKKPCFIIADESFLSIEENNLQKIMAFHKLMFSDVGLIYFCPIPLVTMPFDKYLKISNGDISDRSKN